MIVRTVTKLKLKIRIILDNKYSRTQVAKN